MLIVFIVFIYENKVTASLMVSLFGEKKRGSKRGR